MTSNSAYLTGSEVPNYAASTLADELATDVARRLALGKEVGTWQGSWHLARKLALGKEVGT
jgi:hypothetical protein